MDIQRPASVARQKKLRRASIAIAAILVVGVVSVALARLKPAAPTVERATVWVDPSSAGAMLRQVRGPGHAGAGRRGAPLAAATTQGRVERIVLRPGAQVTPDTIILELSDPQLQQQLLETETQMRAAEADCGGPEGPARDRAAQPAFDRRHGRGRLRAGQARARGQRGSRQGRPRLEPDPEAVTVKAESLAIRHRLENERLSVAEDNVALAAARAAGARRPAARRSTTCGASRSTSCKVRAGMTGVLQQVPVEVGQQVAPGTNLARVADPTRLKAELRIAETQARDLTIGQVASGRHPQRHHRRQGHPDRPGRAERHRHRRRRARRARCRAARVRI